MNTLTQNFFWGRIALDIQVPFVDNGIDTLIKTDKYRPTPAIIYPTNQEWERAMDSLLKELSKMHIGEPIDYLPQLLKVCTWHINTYTMLIDTDLYCYIDSVILITEKIKRLRGTAFTEDEAKNLWKQYRDTALKSFGPYIWVQLQTNDPEKPVKLIRYPEFKAASI